MAVDLHTWVREALEFSGIKQAELTRLLAKELGRSIERAAVNKMVAHPNPRQKRRRVQPDEMWAIHRITGYRLPAGSASDLIEVPLLSLVSAGKLADASTPIPTEDARKLTFGTDLGRGEFFALTVDGDSMDRISPEGAIIIVNRADRTLVSGKPYVFAIRGETTFKLWQPNDPPYLAPYSTNPGHKPIFVKRKRDLDVIGRVKRSVLDL